MILSSKVRLKPNKLQETQLWKSTGIARFIYNWTLNRQQENYTNGNKFISDNELRKELTQLKKSELSWLNEVSNNVTKQAVKDACNSYKNFFKKLSSFPKFKSKKKTKPSFYNDTSKLKIKEFSVLIEKVGWVRTSEQLPMNTKYTNPRISYDGKYWYISVGTEKVEPKIQHTTEIIGIDVGIKSLAVCSNELSFKNINKTSIVKGIKKKLFRLQRAVSRKYEKNKKGGVFVKTSNAIKLEKKIKLIHRRLKNIRQNYIHKTTIEIAKTKPSKIVVEDLNIKGMMKNRHLSKAMAEQCFAEFMRQIEYKCRFSGIEFVKASRYYPSSKRCNRCGNINKNLKLKDRTYKCILYRRQRFKRIIQSKRLQISIVANLSKC